MRDFTLTSNPAFEFSNPAFRVMLEWITNKLHTVEGIITAAMAFLGTIYGAWKLLFPKFKKGYEASMTIVNLTDHLSGIRKEINSGFKRIEEGLLHNIAIRHAMANAEEDRVFFQTDARGKVVWMSKAWSRWTGMETHAARGSGWELALAEEDHTRTLHQWQLAIDHQRAYEGRFTLLNHFTRDRVAVTVTAEPIRDGHGKILDYFGVMKRDDSPPTHPMNIVGSSDPRS